MNKKLMVGGILGVLLLGVFVVAAVIYQSVSADVTVNEALSISSMVCSVAAFPGESVLCEFSIANAASVDLDTTLAWVEGSNMNNVLYTHDAPKTVTIPASSTEDVFVNFTIASGSPTGDFNGTVTATRI
jgi:hypothetical protein